MEQKTDSRAGPELWLEGEELLSAAEQQEEAWWQHECQRRLSQLTHDLELSQRRKRQQVSKLAELARRWQELERRRLCREQEYLSRCVTRMSSRQASSLPDRPASSPGSGQDTASS